MQKNSTIDELDVNNWFQNLVVNVSSILSFHILSIYIMNHLVDYNRYYHWW